FRGLRMSGLRCCPTWGSRITPRAVFGPRCCNVSAAMRGDGLDRIGMQEPFWGARLCLFLVARYATPPGRHQYSDATSLTCNPKRPSAYETLVKHMQVPSDPIGGKLTASPGMEAGSGIIDLLAVV